MFRHKFEAIKADTVLSNACNLPLLLLAFDFTDFDKTLEINRARFVRLASFKTSKLSGQIRRDILSSPQKVS
mgnify:FL=1